MGATIQVKRDSQSVVLAATLQPYEIVYATDTGAFFVYDTSSKVFIGGCSTGTHSNRPAFGVPNRLYYENDTGALFRDSGTAWVAIASPAIHGVSAHSGNIGTESQVAFVVTGGHSHDGVGSTEVTYSNLAGIPSAFTPSVHGSSSHTGNIGTESEVTFSSSGGHAHTGTDSSKVDHTNLNNNGVNTHTQIDTALTRLANTSGTNTGDETATSIGILINGATAKTTPVDADMLPLMDSGASNVVKKLSWSYIKSVLKTYFDTIYTLVNLGGIPTSQIGNVSGVASLDANSLVIQNPSNATATQSVSKIPISNTDGALDDWVTPDVVEIAADLLEIAYIPTGYTQALTPYSASLSQLSSHLNGISAQLANAGTALTRLANTSGTNTGDQVLPTLLSLGAQAALGFTPENVANKGLANGYPNLNATGLVTQNPAAATETPTPHAIVMADANGKVNSWLAQTPSTNVGMKLLAFTQATTSPAAVFTPPVGTVIVKVVVCVDTVAGALGASVSVGTTTTPNAYSTYCDLSVAGNYIYEPFVDCGSTQTPIVLTITPGGQTFAGRLYLIYQIPV